MTPGVISGRSPSFVTVRASRSTPRYASLRRTSASRSGSISSRAVARRIRPSRCVTPPASTYPRGSVNGISVRMVRPAPVLLDGHVVVVQRELLHDRRPAGGVERAARGVARDPHAGHAPLLDVGALGVAQVEDGLLLGDLATATA